MAMEMVAQKFESFQAIKDEEYRYWQSVSASERIAAGHQMMRRGVSRTWLFLRWTRT